MTSEERIKGDQYDIEKAIGSISLVEAIDRVLDRGIVVDACVRMSLVGVEPLSIEAGVGRCIG